MSKQLVVRALKNTIDLFDPQRLYLLQEEVNQILTITDDTVETILSDYKKDRFTYFEHVFTIFQNAVIRAKQIRQDFYFQEFGLKKIQSDPFYTFANSVQDLQVRIQQNISNFFSEKNLKPKSKQWQKNVRFYNRKYNDHEAAYFAQNDEDKDKKAHQFTFKLLKALSKSLDPHTLYFSPQEAKEMRAYLEKGCKGIGIVFIEDADGIKVQSLVKTGPAFKTRKIHEGDVLVKVNGKVVKESFNKAMRKIQKHDDHAILTFKRADGAYDVWIRKEKMEIKDSRVDIAYEHYKGGVIGKLKLHSFYESKQVSAYEDLKYALRELRKKGPLKGLVLDLRENPGGFLTQAVKVSGLFMKSGIVVICHYTDGDEKYLREIDGRSYYDGPLVILTSKFSASAAEIVAQCLQDYGVGIVVGDPETFGKATIQYQNITDENQHSYKVTIGRYYTVSGKSPQLEGVKSDIVVPSRFTQYPIGERYLQFALNGRNIKPHFEDSLSDIVPSSKKWFQLYYLPHLQKQNSQWTKMLPTLRKKSQERQKYDSEFQNYLHAISKKCQYHTDMQMEEASNIVKDMIQISNKH